MAPPCSPTACSRRRDAFVLVAASGQSSASQFEETLNRFDPQRSQTIGAILNMAEVGNAMSYYAYNVER